MGLSDYFDPNSEQSQDVNATIANMLGGGGEVKVPHAPQGQQGPASPSNPNADSIIESILGKNAAMASTKPSPADALNAAMSSPEFQMAQMKAANTPAPVAPPAMPRNGLAQNPGDKLAPGPGPMNGPVPNPNAVKPAQANDPTAALDMMKKLYGDQYGDEAMKNAITNRNHTQQMTNLQKSANQISAAISKTGMKPLNEDLDVRSKQSEQGINDIITGRKSKETEVEGALKLQDLTDKKALQDPNSDVSKAYRTMAMKLMPAKMKDMPGFDNLSAESIKQNLPMIDIAIKSDMLAQAKQQTALAQQDAAKHKTITKMSEFLNSPEKASRGALGQDAQTVRKAAAFQALATQPGTMTKQDTYELARALDSEISGGMPTAGASAHLMPSSALGSGNAWLQYITGHPQDAAVQDLVARMSASSEREAGVAQARLNAYKLRGLTAFNSVKDTPEYQQLLDQHGLTDFVKNKTNANSLVPTFMQQQQSKANTGANGVAPPPAGKIHVQAADGSHWYIDANKANDLPAGSKVIQ